MAPNVSFNGSKSLVCLIFSDVDRFYPRKAVGNSDP